ncbi:alpha-amylase family glycosyl hydrolase [Haloferula rosea]|uniref:1,4-alpha-glucan branching enzyme n=1 Tax=Haloferula rosea TaxID=490093 RepID=A0A934RBL7_9BACT|nr:alpha-amylase family glycosyl hydrolase [Haloferula rosea]MBK1826001.1 alpha amylase C-terminal domain-containing protein [Haloferula rosea]
MEELPQLVRDDPWLTPYADHIKQRQVRLQESLREIEASHGSLANYANGHQLIGLHRVDDRSWRVREWLPNAKAVSLVGDFNEWDADRHPLAPTEHGLWECSLPADALKHGDHYKLRITGVDGSVRDRLPATVQRVVQDPDTHDFSAELWEPTSPYEWRNTAHSSPTKNPIIYEAHVGMSGEEPRVHSYREFANTVLPRIADGGYNTVQLMAVQEHPYYGSFGYHVSNFFACSSRFGTPEDLKYLIDTAHGLGLAVLLDIVHSHSVKNLSEGLNDLDGSGNLYFHGDDRGEHPQWDSKCFDYGREEVRRFLLSNIRYWLEEFQFDGFRFDGVTSMLYWHRGSTSFDHYDKYFVQDVDEDAILYLQLATTLANQLRPDAILIAEDMSGMPGLCRPVADGGAGFTHRLAMGVPDFWIKLLKHSRDEDWDIGQMWDTLTNRRRGEANIAYAESHDQALVGDKTLAFWLMDQEMYWHMGRGDDHPVIERGIALHKMIRLLTFTLAGEGWLTFMGNEFGHPEWLDFPRQGNDWSYHYCRRQWSLVDNKELKYHYLANFDQAMTSLSSAFGLPGHEFPNQLNLDPTNKVMCIERNGLIFVFNWSVDRAIPDYRFKVPGTGEYRLVLDTDSTGFGGHGRLDASIAYPVNKDGELSIYTLARTAQVFARTKPGSGS